MAGVKQVLAYPMLIESRQPSANTQICTFEDTAVSSSKWVSYSTGNATVYLGSFALATDIKGTGSNFYVTATVVGTNNTSYSIYSATATANSLEIRLRNKPTVTCTVKAVISYNDNSSEIFKNIYIGQTSFKITSE